MIYINHINYISHVKYMSYKLHNSVMYLDILGITSNSLVLA